MIKTSTLFTFILLTFILSVGCDDQEQPKQSIVLTSIEAGEDNSYSNIYRVNTKHLHLDLDVNFDNKFIYGVARHEIENNHADTAIFDIKGLQIQKVTLGKKGKEQNTSYVIGIEDSLTGAPLSVLITPKTKFINIYYQTTDQTTSLHWQTELKTSKTLLDTLKKDTIEIHHEQKPDFVYTLPGEFYTRNWIPLQDVGYKKISYSTTVKVPKGFIPLMGTTNPTQINDCSTYTFYCNTPSSISDIGLTIGKFKHKRLSKRSSVYFLEKVNKRIYNELKSVPFLLTSIEKKYGKSHWKATNFIILPFSSPYNNYQYPCNYFVNPSIFSKQNQSLYDLAKFLLFHWPTSLFTPTCKNNISLEKGIHQYYFHRFTLQTLGKEQAELASKFFINNCLLSERKDFPSTFFPSNIYQSHCTETSQIKTKEIAFKQLKGYLLMKSLESYLGTEKLDHFIKNYITKNQLHNTPNFERDLNHYLVQEEVIHFPLKTWLYTKKIPPFNYNISSKRHIQIHVLVKSFLGNKKFFKLRKTKTVFSRFTQFDWLTFISLLPRNTSPKKLAQLDNHFHLSIHPNKNIQFAWIRYGKKNHYIYIEKPLRQILSLYADKNVHEYFD